MTLKDLPIGTASQIIKVGGNGELRQHFLDMGIIPGTIITKIKTAPMGDPVEFDVSGYELTMRLEDAGKIEVGDTPSAGPSTGSKTTGKSPQIVQKKVLLTPVWVKADVSMQKMMVTLSQMIQFLHMHSLVIKTAVKQHFLISLPALINMLEISLVLLSTVKTEKSEVMQKLLLRIFRAFILCRPTHQKK